VHHVTLVLGVQLPGCNQLGAVTSLTRGSCCVRNALHYPESVYSSHTAASLVHLTLPCSQTLPLACSRLLEIWAATDRQAGHLCKAWTSRKTCTANLPSACLTLSRLNRSVLPIAVENLSDEDMQCKTSQCLPCLTLSTLNRPILPIVIKNLTDDNVHLS